MRYEADMDHVDQVYQITSQLNVSQSVSLSQPTNQPTGHPDRQAALIFHDSSDISRTQFTLALCGAPDIT